MNDRRVADRKQRGSRLTAGGVSAPVSILVGFVVNRIWGQEMDTNTVVALSSLVGSAVTVISLCFWDIRGIFLSWFKKKRRVEDRV